MADLVSLNRAKDAFPNLLDNSQDAVIASKITAASRMIEKFCSRIFAKSSYDERYDSDGGGTILLRNYPVLAIDRVAMAPTALLSVQQTNNTVNSRATVGTQQNANLDTPVATTGLTLTRWASGVKIVDTSITWVTYPTITQVVNAINALNAGWLATVQGSFGNWASADLNPMIGPQNALTVPVSLNAHTTDLNNYEVVPETGEIRFSNPLSQVLSSGFGWMPGVFGGDLMPGVNLPRGSLNVRVQYTAGYNVIPEDLQDACGLLAASLYSNPASAGELKSETLGDYSYERELSERLPKRVLAVVKQYKDHSKKV
jgi:hypothetical protein